MPPTTRALQERDDLLLNATIKLITRRATRNLQNLVQKTHAADIAQIVHGLRPEERPFIYEVLTDPEKAADVLTELLTPEEQLDFIDSLDESRLAAVIQQMATDDLNALLADFPEERAEYLLQFVQGEPSEELLQYDEKTAGHIMISDFLVLPEDITAEEATQKIRELIDAEMIFYVYVTDDLGKLKGVVSLRQLVATRPDTPLREFMTTRVYSVTTSTPQEEVARIVTRYNLLAVPVVDDDGVLVGIVTVDDVIDVIREENTEDMLKFSGTGDVALESSSVWRNLKGRAPWLSVSWFGGVVAFGLLYYLTEGVAQWLLLSAFLPILMGIAGSVATQAATITVRGLATGDIQVKGSWRLLLRELSVTALLGLAFALLLGTIAWAVSPSGSLLPIVVAVTILLNMLSGTILGTLIPLFFYRLNWDPAVATGPLLTATVDIISLLSFLLIARMLL